LRLEKIVYEEIKHYETQSDVVLVLAKPLKKSILISLWSFILGPPLLMIFVDWGGIREYSLFGKILLLVVYYLAVPSFHLMFLNLGLEIHKNKLDGSLKIIRKDFYFLKRKLSIAKSKNPVVFAQKKIPLLVTPTEGFKRKYRFFIKYLEDGKEKKFLMTPNTSILFNWEGLSGNSYFDFRKEELEDIANYLDLKIEFGKIGESRDYVQVLNK